MEKSAQARQLGWQAVETQRRRLENFSLREAFGSDRGRAARYRLDAAGLTLDYSKNLFDEQALACLLGLAAACEVEQQVRAQLGGATVNGTEQRAVLHTLLRGSDAGVPLAQFEAVRATRSRMAELVTRVREGQWRGWNGAVIRNVVNIGIGGSHLGPQFATEALAWLGTAELRCHFVANVDPRDLDVALAGLDPATTLFVVASKTFGTLETLANARAARAWLLQCGCPEQQLERHFVAVSANLKGAVDFGIAPAHVLPMWDWVGGRYSLWSAIGLPIALSIGNEQFEALLLGAHRMDMHFRDAPLAANMPVLMALLSVWYRNAWGCASQAVIPYDQGLARLPEFLQQLVMESNGKSVDRDGHALARASSGVIWGAPGTNGQHSFHQMLHQGTDRVPVDFVLPLVTHSPNHEQHAHLVANCIAQSQALMIGRTLGESRAELLERGVEPASAESLAPHLVMPGNRPNNTLVMRAVTPETLGALLALYEHRTAVEGMLWNLDSFDQFGVELGKRLGTEVHRAMCSEASAEVATDSSTAWLIDAYRRARQPQ